MTAVGLSDRSVHSGWTVVPAGYLFRREKRTGFDDEQLLSVYRDFGVVPKSSRDDNFNKASEDLSAYQLVEPNDLVINKMKAWQGSLGVSEHKGIVSPAYFVASPTRDFNRRFVHYLLRSDNFLVEYQTRSAGIRVNQWDLDWEDFRRIPLALPALAEQERIANFLDDKTARIDALIAEKEKLLALLAEQRISIAERVVADATSGVKAKLGFYVDLLPGFAFPSDEFSRDEDNIPLLRGVNVAPQVIRWDDVVYWRRDHDPALERFRLKEGDVVFGMDRPWISTGARVAMVDADSAGALLLQRVCRLRCGKKMRQRFLAYALSSDAFRQSVEMDLTGVSVPHISPEQILSFKVPILTLEEQDSRCEEADRQAAVLRNLSEHTESLLYRLREYRSSLISAAVAGQLTL